MWPLALDGNSRRRVRMKKILVSALVAGAVLVNISQTEAYHVIKQHRNPKTQVQTAQEEVKEVASIQNNPQLTATASARTDRRLLSEETPESIYSDTTVQNSLPSVHSPGEYLMRSGDQLQIVVYGHEDLSTRPGVSYTPYVVRPDGKLAMPLIGDVNCQNRTVPEVALEITNRLAEYIIDPQVTINITKLGTTRVYVLGEVRQQGLYELEKSHTLLDAVSRAGGFTQKSTKRRVFVVRKGMDNFVTQVNLLELLKGGQQKANIELQEGDCVYISSNHKIGLQAIFNAIYSIANTVERIDDVRD